MGRGRPAGLPHKSQPHKFQYQRMTERHHEIVRLIVVGLDNKTIGAMLGVTPQTVSNIRCSPLAQQYIDVLQAARDAETVDIGRSLLRTAQTGASYLESLMAGREDEVAGVTPTLKVKVAQDALSRVGHSPIVRSHIINEEKITPEVIELIKERSAQAKRAMAEQQQQAALTSDAEFEDLSETAEDSLCNLPEEGTGTNG